MSNIRKKITISNKQNTLIKTNIFILVTNNSYYATNKTYYMYPTFGTLNLLFHVKIGFFLFFF